MSRANHFHFELSAKVLMGVKLYAICHVRTGFLYLDCSFYLKILYMPLLETSPSAAACFSFFFFVISFIQTKPSILTCRLVYKILYGISLIWRLFVIQSHQSAGLGSCNCRANPPNLSQPIHRGIMATHKTYECDSITMSNLRHLWHRRTSRSCTYSPVTSFRGYAIRPKTVILQF